MTEKRSKFRWIWENMKGRRVLYIIALLGTVVYNILQITVPHFSGRIIDEFFSGENALQNLTEHKDVLWGLIIAMIGLTILRAIIVYLDCMAYEHVSQTVLYRIRNFLFNKIERQDMTFYSFYRTGDLMTRLTGDLDAVRHNVAWVIRMLIETVSLALVTSCYMIYLNPKVGLSLVGIAPIILIITMVFRKKVGPMHTKLRAKLATMNTAAQENISGNRVVKAFASEEYEIQKFDECNSDFRDTNKKTQLLWIKFFPYVEMAANMLPAVLLLTGGIFLIKGEMTMGNYVSYTGMTWALAVPMRMLGNILNEFQRFSSAADKIMEVYYSEPEIKDADDAIDVKERIKGKIEFRNVSFTYEDGKEPILKDISLTINPGETIAIMGETGCGKTSLIQLIPRFYDTTEGEVLVDDVNVKKYKLEQLRRSIGLATQDVLLYSDTIDGNIAYGDLDLPKEDVEKYASIAQASEFINEMPEGYDTVVGERGVGLSGGQKQRISLARALAVKPSILILDDTTSAVDMETEKLIQKSLSELDNDCTKIIIAQRISSTKNADKIIVIKDGKIEEMGTHKELIARKGYYLDLVMLQLGESADFIDYRETEVKS